MKEMMIKDSGVVKGVLLNFYENENIKSIDPHADASELVDGSYMFCGRAYSSTLVCKITDWNIDLPNLKFASQMFTWGKLTKWNANLPKLIDGYLMFGGCTAMTSFKSDLSSLVKGDRMFDNCPKAEFSDFNLYSLSSGSGMFQGGTSLSKTSALSVLNTIPTYTSGSHPLHLGKSTKFKDSEEIAALLNTTTPIAAKNYSYKGWTITITN